MEAQDLATCDDHRLSPCKKRKSDVGVRKTSSFEADRELVFTSKKQKTSHIMSTEEESNRRGSGHSTHVRESHHSLSSGSVADSNWSVVSQHRLPPDLIDNEYILRYNRPRLRSFRLLFFSAFRLHNETVNVWTHLLGAIGCLILMIYDMTSTTLTMWQKIWFLPFFLASIYCLIMSAIYHWFFPHSRRVSHVLSRLDYSGIVILTVASFLPWVNYAFVCYPYAQAFYLFLNATLGLVCLFVLMTENFDSVQYRPVRAAVFAGLGLTGVVPAFHYYLLLVQPGNQHKILGFGFWLLVMAMFYLGGALIYALRVPERWWPGVFDIFGSSHQILHVSVLLGVLSCYFGINKLASHTYDVNFSCEMGSVSYLP